LGNKTFPYIEKCHRGIEEFFDDMIACDKNVFSRNYDSNFIEKIFSLLFDEKHIHVMDETKNIFTITDSFSSGNMLKVW
jgi:hypothetical protein